MEVQRKKYLLDRYVSFVGRTFDRYVETLIYGFVVWIQVFLLISDVQSSTTSEADIVKQPTVVETQVEKKAPQQFTIEIRRLEQL